MSEEKPYITLQQALKKYDLVASGGHAKLVIQNGEVEVDGVVETRRGRKLYGGEKLVYQSEVATVKNVD